MIGHRGPCCVKAFCAFGPLKSTSSVQFQSSLLDSATQVRQNERYIGQRQGIEGDTRCHMHLLWNLLSISCYGSWHNSYFDLQIICRMLFLVSAHPNCVKHQFTGIDNDAGNSNNNHHQPSNISPCPSLLLPVPNCHLIVIIGWHQSK